MTLFLFKFELGESREGLSLVYEFVALGARLGKWQTGISRL